MNTRLYFTCLWGKTPRAWLSIKPYKGGINVGKVKWRGQPIEVQIDYGSTVRIQKVREKYPLDLYALLKSNLQKQVRRGKIGAVASAARLWDLGQFELLRRLAIIAPEDAEVSTETAVIVWLMAAKSKGFTLDADHRAWVLGYTRALVEHPVCRRLEIKPEREHLNSQLTCDDVYDSFHNQSETIAAILFRTAYGGLKGDPPMLSRCLDWMIQTDNPLPVLGVKRWTEPLPKLLVNRAAIDHHIYPGVIDELHSRYPEYSEDLLATTVWECSSGYNMRKERDSRKEWRKCWKVIQADFKELGKSHLARILERFNGL